MTLSKILKYGLVASALLLIPRRSSRKTDAISPAVSTVGASSVMLTETSADQKNSKR